MKSKICFVTIRLASQTAEWYYTVGNYKYALNCCKEVEREIKIGIKELEKLTNKNENQTKRFRSHKKKI